MLELLIVVAGILIALQVDNWNEQRKAREQAAQWKQQLIADLRQNKDDLQGRLVYMRQALALPRHRSDTELQYALRGRLSQLKVSTSSVAREIESAESVIQLLR